MDKVDDRIPILQLDRGAKDKTKTKPRYESRKVVLKLELGSRFDGKNSRNIQGSYELNYDQLIDMHYTQN